MSDPLAGMIWHIAGPPDILSVRAEQPARVSVLTPRPGFCLGNGNLSATALFCDSYLRLDCNPCMSRRVLSDGEAAIFAIIQQGYSPQNSPDKVFFTKTDEAVLFIKASDGTSPLMANLSNLATWRADGTISTDEGLKGMAATGVIARLQKIIWGRLSIPKLGT